MQGRTIDTIAEKISKFWKKVLDFSATFDIMISVLDTQRISVTVAHRTLTPFAGVRIPHPLPRKHRNCDTTITVFSAIFAFGELNLRCKLNWLSSAKLPAGSWGEYNLALCAAQNLAVSKKQFRCVAI